MKKLHEKVLEYFLQYKENTDKKFTFYMRQSNRSSRLENGFWFLGNENYINIPLFNVGDSDNRTQTIGFIFENEEKCFIEIVYKNIIGITENELNFYKELIAFLPNSEQKANQNRFWYVFDDNNIFQNIDYYINDFRRQCIKLLQKYHLEDRYLIKEEEFQRKLENINNYRNSKTIETPQLPKTFTTINNNKIKNIILYGVPGVGKTFSHKKIINLVEDNYSDSEIFDIISANTIEDNNEAFFTQKLYKEVQDENRVKFITFHQSFGYEDFIEGFRPNEEGKIKLENGVFKELCEKAQEDKENNYYLIIDEINRGNISKIFGELITLIEEDKRDSLHVTLPYSKKPFSIPSNLYIIGTMNSTDKSIALIDIALRRRFTFIHMKPNPELVKKYPEAKELMIVLNSQLEDEHKIGHSYFMQIENEEDLVFTCKYKIKPLLEEYFYGDKDGLANILKFLPTNV